MRQIPLSQGKYALVDDEDFEWLQQYSWCYSVQGGGIAYVVGSVDGKMQRIHRLISGAPEGKVVDHRNGNTLDNQRHNLRVCTQAYNRANSRIHKDNLAGYKGVSYSGSRRKKCWEARICKHYKTIHLGRYYTKEEAARAYNEKAQELFGDFALLNHI